MTNEKESTEETTVVATEATTVETTVEPPRGTTETTYTCNSCGATVVPVQVETPTGPRNQCPNCGKLMKLAKNKAPPSPLEKEKQETLWKEDVEPTEVLRSILSNHPDVTSSQVGEIMDWAKYGMIEPYVLTQLLASMKGMTDRRAALIGYKYGLALNKIQGRKPLPFPNFIMGLQQQGGETLPFLSMPQSWNRQPSPQGGSPGGDGGMSEGRVSKLLDDRERKAEAKRKEDSLVKTLDGVRLALNNLNARVSGIEQGSGTKNLGEKVGNPLQEQVNMAVGKKLTSVILGEGDSVEKLKILAKELRGGTPAPAPGSRNEYDMRVEQAQHEAGARKIEAEERRKSFEAIGAGIRDGLQGLGFNVGAGLSAGPAGTTPAPNQLGVMEPSEPQLPIRGGDGQLYVECPHCRTPLMVPEGQARVVCQSCGGIVSIMTREEATRTNEALAKKKPEAKKQAKKPNVEKTELVTKTEKAQKTEKLEKPKRKEKLEGSDVKVVEKVEGVAT